MEGLNKLLKWFSKPKFELFKHDPQKQKWVYTPNSPKFGEITEFINTQVKTPHLTLRERITQMFMLIWWLQKLVIFRCKQVLLRGFGTGYETIHSLDQNGSDACQKPFMVCLIFAPSLAKF